jgi:glycosyltransferase involved in cell wall biosynthesis
MKEPFFSVVIPAYNRAALLKIAVDSVLGQSFSDFELLVIDDGSDDNTHELMSSFKDPRLRFIKISHSGVSSARNKGINDAKGEYIAFLDSDDRFCKDKLAICAQIIKEQPIFKIFHTEEIWYKQGKILSAKKYHQKPSGNIFRQALKLCCVSPSTAIVHYSVFREVGLFDEDLPACEDYDFWLRAACKYPFLLIPEPLTIKDGGRQDQQSNKYPAMDRFRIYAIEKLIKNNPLDKEHRLLAYQELENKCRIYTQGALKRNNRLEVRRCQVLLEKLKVKI